MRDEELRRIIDESDAEIRARRPEPEPHYLRPVQASLLDPAEELAAAKADPNGRELSPAAQALYEAEGVARFAAMHGGRNRPWEWLDSPRGVLPSDGGQQ